MTTAVTLLRHEPRRLPEGRPPAAARARDDDVAGRLGYGVADLLDAARGPWTLRLAGLPLGDPTLSVLATLMPGASLATSAAGGWSTSWTPSARCGAVGTPRSSSSTCRPCWPASIGSATSCAPQPGCSRRSASWRSRWCQYGDHGPAAVLLTLLDPRPGGTDRWPWWGSSDVGGLRELGSPWVSLTASAGLTELGARQRPALGSCSTLTPRSVVVGALSGPIRTTPVAGAEPSCAGPSAAIVALSW